MTSESKLKNKATEITLHFIIFSIIGWLYEEILWFVHGDLVNRGFCFGPWLPVYGIGGILILALFWKAREKINPAVMVIITGAFAASIELAATYILDITGLGHETLWDYNGKFANFQGRIALWPSIKFGLLAVLMMYGISPCMQKLDYSDKRVIAATWILAAVFAVDVIWHCITGSNY